MVEEFVDRTGRQLGHFHQVLPWPGKAKAYPDGSLPELRYDILENIQRRLPGFPIETFTVSTILPKYVEMINAYGGKFEQAVGIPEEQISKAAKWRFAR